MPPTPPRAAFDARFGSQRIVETYAVVSKTAIEFPIEIRSATGSVTISWVVKDHAGKYSLTDASGKVLTTNGMYGTGSLRMAQSTARQLVLTVASQDVPREFSLHQNYPNPFNPSTTIRFDLPSASIVTLKIYNVIGQEVSAVLESQSFAAGEQAVRFDASTMPSGIYFYWISAKPVERQTDLFQGVKKMLLIR